MSKLLIDEYPLQVSPTLATKIGLNEAIVLQQIHYWLETYKKTSDSDTKAKHFHNNMWWIYNTYEQWQEQFPFWCLRTIKTIIKSLENKDLLIVGKFNKFGYDRTKWYTINYKVLETLENTHSANLALSKVQMLHEQKCKTCTTNTIDYNREYNKDYSKRVYKGFSPSENLSAPTEFNFKIVERQIKSICKEENITNSDEIVDIVRYYYGKYKLRTGTDHPRLKQEQMKSVVNVLVHGTDLIEELDFDSWRILIDKHFDTDYGFTHDWNINLFIEDEIINNRFYETLY